MFYLLVCIYILMYVQIFCFFNDGKPDLKMVNWREESKEKFHCCPFWEAGSRDAGRQLALLHLTLKNCKERV